jgi:hypothetical protein
MPIGVNAWRRSAGKRPLILERVLYHEDRMFKEMFDE